MKYYNICSIICNLHLIELSLNLFQKQTVPLHLHQSPFVCNRSIVSNQRFIWTQQPNRTLPYEHLVRQLNFVYCLLYWRDLYCFSQRLRRESDFKIDLKIDLKRSWRGESEMFSFTFFQMNRWLSVKQSHQNLYRLGYNRGHHEYLKINWEVRLSKCVIIKSPNVPYDSPITIILFQ